MMISRGNLFHHNNRMWEPLQEGSNGTFIQVGLATFESIHSRRFGE